MQAVAPTPPRISPALAPSARCRRTLLSAAALLLCASPGLGCRGTPPPPAQSRSAATAAPPAALHAAFIYQGPADDGGWNASHERARKALQSRFGDKLQISVLADLNDPAELATRL